MPSPAIASIGIGLATLRANPLRTGLSTLGIIIGAASLVAVLALGDGIEQFGRMQLQTTTDLQSIVVQPRTVELIDGQAYQLDRLAVFTPATVDSLLALLPELGTATLTLGGTLPIVPGDSSAGVAQVGLTLADAGAMFQDKLTAGRYFTANEASASAQVVVLSHGLAARLTGTDAASAVGRTVQLRGTSQTVVGVLAKTPGELSQVYAPIGSQYTLLAPTPRPRAPTMILQARQVESVSALQQGVERWLAANYGEWKRYASVQSNQARVKQVTLGMRVFKGFMGAITGISLIVGGIGIMNVLLAAVAERTREIGVRKAIGARRRDVLAQFLAESVAISGAGSIVGAILGLAAAFGITAVIRQQTQAMVFAGFSWGTMAVSAISALVIGLAFGIYPALRASRLSPIDAIRHD